MDLLQHFVCVAAVTETASLGLHFTKLHALSFVIHTSSNIWPSEQTHGYKIYIDVRFIDHVQMPVSIGTLRYAVLEQATSKTEVPSALGFRTQCGLDHQRCDKDIVLPLSTVKL